MSPKVPRSQTESLRTSDERFRLFVEEVQDYAIFMLDPQGKVVTWNLGGERLKGYKACEIVGKHFSCFYPAEDVQSGQPEIELEVAAKIGRLEDEGYRLRKDGSRFWANVIITALRDENGKLYGFGKVTRDATERKLSEERLRESEERFRLMVEHIADYAVFMLDPAGYVTTWNSGAERIKGYRPLEIIGKHFSSFYTQEDVESGLPQRVLDLATIEGEARQEGWRLRKNGSRFWANVLVTAIRDSSGKLLGFSKFTRDLTEKRAAEKAIRKEAHERERAQQKLAESEESLRQLSVSLLRMQDEERRRIGREMHDSLGQYLSVLKMKVDSLKAMQAGPDDPAYQELTACTKILTECVKEVRTISYLLYPPLLEERGLKSAIPWYVEGFSERSGIRTTLDMPQEFERLPKDLELTLFRVLQEALTNVHRHSGSPDAEIRLSTADGSVCLEVRDHGNGLPGALVAKLDGDWNNSFGVGLRGMRERLRQFGGKVDLISDTSGTKVIAVVPLPHKPSPVA